MMFLIFVLLAGFIDVGLMRALNGMCSGSMRGLNGMCSGSMRGLNGMCSSLCYGSGV